MTVGLAEREIYIHGCRASREGNISMAVELVVREISMEVGLVEREISMAVRLVEREISMAVGLVEREIYPWQ